MAEKPYNGSKIKLSFIPIIVILFALLILNVQYHNNIVNATSALREAKNIQLAMRLLAIEYYGEDRVIYEMNTPHGMADDTVERIKYLSGADGDVTLLYWNYEKGLPGKFYFQTDSFLVVYEYNELEEELVWRVYQTEQLIELG